MYDLRERNTPVSAVQPIPYFENLFPGYATATLTPTQRAYREVARTSAGGLNGPDWTYLQLLLDDRGVRPNAFYHPQYAALSTWSTVAYSDYHAGTLTVRERLQNHLTVDLNYTCSKSTDIASGLERTSSAYDYSTFILNPLRPEDNKAISDFDISHIVNSSSVWELPFGRGRAYLNSMHPLGNALLGGWQLTGIFRWNSGLPERAPFDAEVWATNWNVQSKGTRVRALEAAPTKSGDHPTFSPTPRGRIRVFATRGRVRRENVTFSAGPAMLARFRPGKSFNLPVEGHAVQFRWEVFNATNTQRLAGPQITEQAMDCRSTLTLAFPRSISGNLRHPGKPEGHAVRLAIRLLDPGREASLFFCVFVVRAVLTADSCCRECTARGFCDPDSRVFLPGTSHIQPRPYPHGRTLNSAARRRCTSAFPTGSSNIAWFR